jgi:hypothetical protein
MCDLRPVHKRQMCQPTEHCGHCTVFIQKNSSFTGSSSFCNTPNASFDRGHSGQNCNNLGQLPNTSIVLQEVVVLLCVECLLFCCCGWCRGCCFVVVVGEVWETHGSFLFYFLGYVAKTYYLDSRFNDL